MHAAALAMPRTRGIADRLVLVEETASTNTLASHMLAEGSLVLPAASRVDDGMPAVAVVAANRQSAGRGRNGHVWQSRSDSCSTVSYIVRVPRRIATDPTRNGWLQMAIGLATLGALRGVIGDCGASAKVADLRLKWPNDVFCDGKKMGGLLAELVFPRSGVLGVRGGDGGRGAAGDDAQGGVGDDTPNDAPDDVMVVFGVGLNLTLGADELPTANATSLGLRVAGLPPFGELRDQIAERTVRELRRRLKALIADAQGEVVALREEVLAVDWTRGHQVEAHFTDGSTLRGEAIGLGEDASLRLRTPDGEIHDIRTADVGVL